MPLSFHVGDRISLTANAVAFYGGSWPHFIPQGQGGGSVGTVVEAGERPHKPGAAPRPYLVAWDNGVVNSYREEDLIMAGTHKAADPGEIGERPDNIVAFKRL